jgi:hypothetical protein
LGFPKILSIRLHSFDGMVLWGGKSLLSLYKRLMDMISQPPRLDDWDLSLAQRNINATDSFLNPPI